MVVGNGMASVRLVEALAARRSAGSAEALEITVVGAERHAAYNRILLSAVLEGTHRPGSLTLRTPEWYAAHGIDLRLGTRAVEVHRDRRVVELADGSEVAYDELVLATGSMPSLPPIRGLVRADGVLDPRVHAFRSLDDCAGLLDAMPTARRAIVVGAGLLGIQVARALAVRGIATEIVEGAEHVLHRQVDAAAGAVLERSLRRLGTEVYTGARAVRLTEAGVRLDTGVTLDTDLLVLCAGGRPNAHLARRAGLTVRHGVVVDRHLRSIDDPHVYAIGDCAQPLTDRVQGFVAPAWEQAEVLAAVLTGDTGEQATYDGHRLVARLRATDVEVAVLGDPQRECGESVEMSNPVRGAHRRLIVRDGRIVAGTLVGDLTRIGLITQHFTRGTVLGLREVGALLLPEVDGSSAGAAAIGDEIEVCACAGVAAGRIRACASIEEVRERTRATTGCGGCASAVQSLLGRASVRSVSR